MSYFLHFKADCHTTNFNNIQHGSLQVLEAEAKREVQSVVAMVAHTYPYLEWGHLMCSHSFRCASRFIVSSGGQLGLLGQRTGR